VTAPYTQSTLDIVATTDMEDFGGENKPSALVQGCIFEREN
jgi:hypothetical protein